MPSSFFFFLFFIRVGCARIRGEESLDKSVLKKAATYLGQSVLFSWDVSCWLKVISRYILTAALIQEAKLPLAYGLPLRRIKLCGYENRWSDMKGFCGSEAVGWWVMRWRRLLSLKFNSHLASPHLSLPKNFSVHTALCIAIVTFLLITTETSFPAPDKETSLPVESAYNSHFFFFKSPPPSSTGWTYGQPPLFTIHFLISTYSPF